MSRFLSVLSVAVLAIIGSIPLFGQSKTSRTPPLELVAIQLGIDGIALDSREVGTVSSIMLQRDVGTFVLEQGTIYLCKPMKGRIRAALFVGQGTFSYTPPITVERQQLGRFLGSESLQEEFTSMFLLFGDSTLQELSDGVTFADGVIPEEVEAPMKDAMRGLFGEAGYTFHYEMTRQMLDDEHDMFFVAYMGRDKKEPLCFAINPYEPEEVMLLHTYKDPVRGGVLEPVNQFQTSEEYMNGVDFHENKDLLQVTAYTIDCSIDDGLAFHTRADVRFRVLASDRKWLVFDLFPTLDVDSMRWGDGSPAEFFKGTNTSYVWVKNRPGVTGSEQVLTMDYHGKMLVRRDDWFHLMSSIEWYPTHGYKQKSTFDLTFHTPEEFTFVAVGDKVSSETNDGIVTSHWVTGTPIRNASFNLGIFKEYDIESEKTAPIKVLMSKNGHREMAERMIAAGITSGRNMEKQVGEDVKLSLEFFSHIYGELPIKQFYATEIPGSHGEAFPGLIHLAWSTFQRNDEKGFDELFRAHEVGHQWWGIGVDFASYHDQWLSEGFAEYSGLLYLQSILKDNDRFFYWLRNYREALMKNRKSIFGSGQEAGPIWLGQRTRSANTAGDYDLVIYKKGAWVLHMLRNLVMDPMKLNDDAFLAIMKDFFTTYYGRDASTQDFQRIVEKHVGVDMQWFFNEWVYGTDIPTYRFAYRTAEAPDGKYVVTCGVRQTNVADDFQMYLPIRIVFTDGTMARVRVLVKGPYSEFDLPVLPKKPKEVILNDLESVLCEVENIDWNERTK